MPLALPTATAVPAASSWGLPPGTRGRVNPLMKAECFLQRRPLFLLEPRPPPDPAAAPPACTSRGCTGAGRPPAAVLTGKAARDQPGTHTVLLLGDYLLGHSPRSAVSCPRSLDNGGLWGPGHPHGGQPHVAGPGARLLLPTRPRERERKLREHEFHGRSRN